MIDYSYLSLQNPWWRSASAIEEDDKIKEFEGLKFQYRPTQILDAVLQTGDIILITGPRQTGKSTGLKLLIRKLIREERNPHSLFYFNCDALSSEKDVIDVIVQFQESGEYEKTVIFLDEISSIPNWPQGIKWLADAGLTKNTTLFLTGSSSINLKKSGEFLPGRRGRGKDIHFLPLSFSEYLALHNIRTDPIGAVTVKKLAELSSIRHAVQKQYKVFLSTGGFLRNINYGITETGNDLYLKTLKSELYKAGKKEDNLREVVRKILASLSSQTSYTNIAEEAELGSKNTSIDYLNFLADSF
ncbi:ATP-binding protein, partial [Candidatus Gottesmanbacteria bacterium]|nr:ATP-binding protein [Candidatus Gottesmanbacteria bacterium]